MPQPKVKRHLIAKRRLSRTQRVKAVSKAKTAPRFRILVCDDEPKLCHIVTELAADLAHCDTAANGLEALHKLKAHQYDLLVLDLKMPKMDGLAVLQALRQGQRELRVIILTAHQDLEIAHQVYRTYGVHAYFTKPFNIHEVHAAIKCALVQAPQPV